MIKATKLDVPKFQRNLKIVDISRIWENIYVGNQVAADSKEVLVKYKIWKIVRLRSEESLDIPGL
jgi:hypothetical protein